METARRRLRITRYAIGVTAATVFGGGVAAVRAAHPGSHGATKQSTVAAAALDAPASFRTAEQQAQSSTFGVSGSSSIAPATSAPVIQSGGS